MQNGIQHRLEHVDPERPFLHGGPAHGAEALALDEDVGGVVGEDVRCQEGVGVGGVGGGGEGFFGLWGGGGGEGGGGNVDAGPVREGWGYGWWCWGFGVWVEPGGWEDEVAVGEVADAHVDADDFVVIFSRLLFLFL